MGRGVPGQTLRRTTASPLACAVAVLGFLGGTGIAVVPVALAQEGNKVPPPALEPAEGARGAAEKPDSAVERTFPQLASYLPTPPDGYSPTIFEWDREAILRSNAFTLVDLLTEIVPGLVPVRAEWFGGPHQIVNGLFGPGFVSIRLDGRELTSLEGGQVDLSRVPLASIDHVRVVRFAGGWRVELTTLQRSAARAYSRITGGTGDPGLSRLRLLFSNSAGRHLNFSATADLLDTSGDNESDSFDFWGNIEWLPGEGGSGLELHWKNQSLTRSVFGAEDLTRREVFVRGRGNLAPGLQVEGFAGSTELQEDGEKVRDFDHAGFRLAATGEAGWIRGGVQTWDSRPFPAVDADLSLGARPFAGIGIDVGGRVTSWDGFRTAEIHGGVAADGLPLGGRITVQAATGTRAVAYPATGLADSLSFDAASARGSIGIGELRLSESVELQRLSRQLPFGARFDPGSAPRGEAEALVFDTEVAGPILPLSWILDELAPLRLRGGWRYISLRSGEEPAYFPQNVVRGELFFQDDFFEDELEVRLGISLDRRDAMLAPAGVGSPEGTELAAVPSYTFVNFNMMIRVLDVRIYWRYDNLTTRDGEDLPGLSFPRFRTVFGVKWEFLN